MIELLRTYHDIWSSDSVLELRYRFKEKVSFEGIAVQKATLDSLGSQIATKDQVLKKIHQALSL